jgi:hypothetical protein
MRERDLCPNNITLSQMAARLPMTTLPLTTCGKNRKEACTNISTDF